MSDHSSRRHISSVFQRSSYCRYFCAIFMSTHGDVYLLHTGCRRSSSAVCLQNKKKLGKYSSLIINLLSNWVIEHLILPFIRPQGIYYFTKLRQDIDTREYLSKEPIFMKFCRYPKCFNYTIFVDKLLPVEPPVYLCIYWNSLGFQIPTILSVTSYIVKFINCSTTTHQFIQRANSSSSSLKRHSLLNFSVENLRR